MLRSGLLLVDGVRGLSNRLDILLLVVLVTVVASQGDYRDIFDPV